MRGFRLFNGPLIRTSLFYTGLGILIICSKNVVVHCLLTIPTLIVGSWFTGGQ